MSITLIQKPIRYAEGRNCDHCGEVCIELYFHVWGFSPESWKTDDVTYIFDLRCDKCVNTNSDSYQK